MPGPLPLPTAVKKLRGTYRADRANPHEPLAPALTKTPAPPDWLSADGRNAWRRIVRLLVSMRVLSGADLDLAAVLADQLGTYEQAGRALKDKASLTFVVTDGDGTAKAVQPWPEIKIKQAAAAEIRRLVEHFGLSPSSRSRIAAIVPAAPAEDDPFAEFETSPLDRIIHRQRISADSTDHDDEVLS